MRLIKEILVWLGIMLDPITVPTTMSTEDVREFGRVHDPVCYELYSDTRSGATEFGLRCLLGHGLWDDMIASDDGTVVSRVANWLIIEDDSGHMQWVMFGSVEAAEDRLCTLEPLIV